DRKRESALACRVDHTRHIRRVGHSCYHARPLIEAAHEHGTRLVVAGILGREDASFDRGAKIRNRTRRGCLMHGTLQGINWARRALYRVVECGGVKSTPPPGGWTRPIPSS